MSNSCQQRLTPVGGLSLSHPNTEQRKKLNLPLKEELYISYCSPSHTSISFSTGTLLHAQYFSKINTANHCIENDLQI
jgi:hypothetical protein